MAICRPQEFLASIQDISSARDLLTRINEEKQYLETSYPIISSLKNGYTLYRNYFKANIGADQNIESGEAVLPILLREMKLSDSQQQAFNDKQQKEIKDAKASLRELYNIREYLKIAASLLNQPSYIDRIIGLCALTGRRAAEIGSSAEFKYIGKNNALEFSGQLKTKNRTDVVPYIIPVLYSAKRIIKTLNEIRESKPRYINRSDLFHNAASADLNLRVRKHFYDSFEGIPKVKDLRAIYALISFRRFHRIAKNRKIDRDVYYSQILGHGKDDITTCASYIDFYK